MFQLRTHSARRYRIDGGLPSALSPEFHQRLTDRRFLPLTAKEERSFGWVTADNLLLTTFDVDTVLRGDHAAFGLRIDRRRINPRLLRAQMDLEVRGRRKAAEDAGRPFRFSRDERAQVRSDLKMRLLAETPPSIEAHTLILHTKRRTLWALTLSKTANEVLRAHFRDTFGVDLVPLTPWRRGEEILAGTVEATDLRTLSRTLFASSPVAPTTPDPAASVAEHRASAPVSTADRSTPSLLPEESS